MDNGFQILPVGDSAVLIDLPDLDTTLAVFAQLNSKLVPGVTEIVPAAKTILLSFDNAILGLAELKSYIANAWASVNQTDTPVKNDTNQAKLVEIPVKYNGDDLPGLAEIMGISVSELIDRHTGYEYMAAFAGFAPGFVYLSKGHPSFTNIPRLDTPRTRVLPGSVATAGDFSAIYPKESPGGWRLLGVTPLQMWDLNRAQPALIRPGDRVRFQDLARLDKSYSIAANPVAARPSITQLDSSSALEIIASGVQTLLQDNGRHGFTAMGVSSSGALDRQSMYAANQLVGNPDNTAVIENAMGGLQIRFRGDAVFAVTGADANITLTTAAGVRIPAGVNRKLRAADGNILRILKQRTGMRSYLAVNGGFDIEPVLNSLATDILAGIGPAPIRKGDLLRIGHSTAAASTNIDLLQRCDAYTASLPAAGDTITLDIIAGPRDSWFAQTALDVLCSQAWAVNPQSNRVGLRLQADRAIERINTAELPSEGTVAGAIQVPASGQPVLFLADHPLTGGYPVIAVLASDCLDLAGQIPIGALVRFKLLDN